jgi:hypothetical protein
VVLSKHLELPRQLLPMGLVLARQLLLMGLLRELLPGP